MAEPGNNYYSFWLHSLLIEDEQPPFPDHEVMLAYSTFNPLLTSTPIKKRRDASFSEWQSSVQGDSAQYFTAQGGFTGFFNAEETLLPELPQTVIAGM